MRAGPVRRHPGRWWGSPPRPAAGARSRPASIPGAPSGRNRRTRTGKINGGRRSLVRRIDRSPAAENGSGAPPRHRHHAAARQGDERLADHTSAPRRAGPTGRPRAVAGGYPTRNAAANRQNGSVSVPTGSAKANTGRSGGATGRTAWISLLMSASWRRGPTVPCGCVAGGGRLAGRKSSAGSVAGIIVRGRLD